MTKNGKYTQEEIKDFLTGAWKMTHAIDDIFDEYITENAEIEIPFVCDAEVQLETGEVVLARALVRHVCDDCGMLSPYVRYVNKNCCVIETPVRRLTFEGKYTLLKYLQR